MTETPVGDGEDETISLGSDDSQADEIPGPINLEEIKQLFKGSYAPRIGEKIAVL